MKTLSVVVIVNAILSVATSVIAILGLATPHPLNVSNEYSFVPSQDYVQRMPEAVIVSLESVNPSNMSRQDQILSVAGGNIYYNLQRLIDKRKNIIGNPDTGYSQYVKVTGSSCKWNGETRTYSAEVAAEKVIAYSSGGWDHFTVTYALEWTIAPTAENTNPLGITLIAFHMNDKFDSTAGTRPPENESTHREEESNEGNK